MKFRQYLSELYNIDIGQAETKHEPTNEGSSSISNPKIRAEINFRLLNELSFLGNHLTPQSGIQAIRKVLHRFSLDLPALYDIDPEGDEIAIELNQFGTVFNYDETNEFSKTDEVSKDPQIHYVYIIYYMGDAGNYEFHAEVVTEEGLDNILNDDDDEEDEEELE